MTPTAATAVVHLVRQANGPEAFEAFVASYERHHPGLDHDLVLLFKGFPDRAEAEPYLDRVGALAPRALFVDDSGLDLAAYRHAAAALEHARVCFLNSFSQIQAPGWLGLMARAMDAPGVGAVGATGSWGSPLSYSLFQLGSPRAYRGVFASRAAAREAWHQVAGAQSRGAAAHWLFTLATTAPRFRGMARFPNPHLRTNGFLIDRATFSALRTEPVESKAAAYALENGRGSMTAQLLAEGRTAMVVDRHGTARAPEDWHQGDVFCQAEQADLLVADNQTRSYASADSVQRGVLSGFAWGRHSRPG